MTEKRRVLILCTGNSCRSQLAEALWRARAGDRWEVRSAGSDPTGTVHPLALAVLEESGIPTEGLASEPLSKYADEPFDLVITVCDRAAENCPVLPGAPRTLHWPFPDPAEFAEDAGRGEAKRVFRAARDAIEGRIVRFLARDAEIESFAPWLEQVHGQLPAPPPTERSTAFRAVVGDLTAVLRAEEEPWERLPALIAERYEPFGWAWNGIYALRSVPAPRSLELRAAAGPPVCASIEESPGGIGASGMCFDAVHSGHTLVAADVKSWLGYVSCDDESGLATRAGLVVPIRGPRGVVAVWDLDSTEPLDPTDPPLLTALVERLAAVAPLPKGW